MKKIIFLIIIIFSNQLYAQQDELFFTYIGPAFGGGMNQITYKDWSSETNTRESKNIAGGYFTGGFILDIFVNNVVGEFSLQYINNRNSEKNTTVQHLLFHTAIKYSYELNNFYAITSGLGLFLETPPASRSYNSGGGGNATLGTVLSLSREWKIVIDFICRYGYFGIGEDSTKISLGANIGLVYKVGRI